MTSILLLAYHFLPENGSCTDKNVRLLKTFLRAGHHVTVLTKNKGLFPEIELDDAAVSIVRSTNGVLHRNGVPSVEKSVAVTGRGTLGVMKSIKRKISLLIIPDAAVDWLSAAEKVLDEEGFRVGCFDVIVSTSSPYSSHLLARRLSKKYDVPYILTYGDPWIYEAKRKRGAFRLLLEKCMEASVVKRAEKVFVITEYNRQEYMRLYNLPEEKIGTFHIGCDPVDEVVLPRSSHSDDLRLVYGGSLDPVHRNPAPFVEALSGVSDVYCDIYNEDLPTLWECIKRFGCESAVRIRPLLSSSEFQDALPGYDALVLFGNKTPFQVPGKVFSYIATGMHILYIKNNTFSNDGTEEVLRKYGNYSVTQNNPDDIRGCLTDMKLKARNAATVNDVNAFSFYDAMAPIERAVAKLGASK